MEQNIEFEENAFCKSIDFRIDSKRINLPHLDEERARQLEIGLKLNRNIELIEFERLAISVLLLVFSNCISILLSMN